MEQSLMIAGTHTVKGFLMSRKMVSGFEIYRSN